MKNKLLVLIIIILIPISLYNFEEKKENVDNKEELKKDIVVHLNIGDKIIDLNINDYLIGVVGIEMPASFNIEALKAQAVASRTFAYNYLQENEINISTSAQGYIDKNQMKEKWGDNFEKYYNKIRNSVISTNNEVIKYNGKIIKSYYYAISNGKSESSISVFNEDLPYLISVDSTFDQEVKNFEVTTSFTYENFCNLLNIYPCIVKVDNIIKDDTNRVSSIDINNINYSGIELRKILSLRSTDFIINLKDDHIDVITKGYGHGVGMSQYGANYLANNSNNYKEILYYYYNGVEVTSF